MTARGTLRVAAVLDGTGPNVERQARALGAFLRDGLELPPETRAAAVTHVFCDAPAAEHVIGLAPTRDVRLAHTPRYRPDLITAALTAFEDGGGADLYVFPDGPLGTEVASRLAVRAKGAVLTGVLRGALAGGLLVCRRSVYSNHLEGRFELGPRPWCITLDAGWADAHSEPPDGHAVEAAAGLPDDVLPAPAALQDIEPLVPPPTGDLEAARFLVVAGRGAGGRDGVERLAAAAARMGASFGVTRPVAMNAWATPDRQIGVSGTRTAPAVCIVAGASGAPALMWGVERADFIAAVDIDERAAIVTEADAVVLDDAVAVLEALADLAG